MYSYKCYFNFPKLYLGRGEAHTVIGEDGLHAFTKGFWLTENLKLTKGSDCVYWIPPSQILFIERREIAKNGS